MSASTWGLYLAYGVPEAASKQALAKESLGDLVNRSPAKGLDGWGTYLARGVDPNVYLLFGKSGWIGGKLIELLRAKGKTVYLADSRTYDREEVLREVDKYRPTHILNAAGVTGALWLPCRDVSDGWCCRSTQCGLV